MGAGSREEGFETQDAHARHGKTYPALQAGECFSRLVTLSLRSSLHYLFLSITRGGDRTPSSPPNRQAGSFHSRHVYRVINCIPIYASWLAAAFWCSIARFVRASMPFSSVTVPPYQISVTKRLFCAPDSCCIAVHHLYPILTLDTYLDVSGPSNCLHCCHVSRQSSCQQGLVVPNSSISESALLRHQMSGYGLDSNVHPYTTGSTIRPTRISSLVRGSWDQNPWRKSPTWKVMLPTVNAASTTFRYCLLCQEGLTHHDVRLHFPILAWSTPLNNTPI